MFRLVNTAGRQCCRHQLVQLSGRTPAYVKAPGTVLHLAPKMFSSAGLDPALRKRMDALADLFVEARDEIEMATESKGTTYFNEEAEAAADAVSAAVNEYEAILAGLEEPGKGEFQRGNGLKMEQLRAEYEILLEDDDH